MGTRIFNSVFFAAVVLVTAANAETITNRKTGQVLKGGITGTTRLDGKEMIWFKTEKGTRLFLAKADWEITQGSTKSSKGPVPRSKVTEPEPTASTEETGLTRVIASGAGQTQDEALKAALLRAVEQAVGLLVDAETIVENDKVVKDQILTASNAFVQKYELLKQWREDATEHCQILALVQSGKLRERLEASHVATGKVDGQGLFARVYTEGVATQNAAKLIRECLQDFPKGMLTIRGAGDPVPTTGEGLKDGMVRLRIPFKIATDTAAYGRVLAAIEPTLAKLALVQKKVTLAFRPGKDRYSLWLEMQMGPSYRVVTGQWLDIDRNPVFPRPGDLVPAAALWEVPSRWGTRIGFDEACEAFAQEPERLGRRLALIVTFSNLAADGRTMVTTYAMDERAMPKLPALRAGRFKWDFAFLVRVALRDQASRVVAETARKVYPWDKEVIWLLETHGQYSYSSRHGTKSPVTAIVPGLLCTFHDSLAQCWQGHAYIDVTREALREVRTVDFSIKWEPGSK